MKDKQSNLKKNKKDLALVLCPPSGITSPNYGVASLISYLKKKKLKIDFIDMNIELYNNVSSSLKEMWEDRLFLWSSNKNFPLIKKRLSTYFKSYARKIISKNTDIVAFSVNHSNILVSYEIVKIIKKVNPDIKIIFGGSGIVISCERERYYQDKIIDVFIVGYGEKRLGEVVTKLLKNETLDGLNDIIFLSEKKEYIIERNFCEEGIKKIENEIISSDILVDFDDFKIKQYKEEALPLLFSTGCIGNCSFCSDTVLMGEYTSFSAEKVVKQIKTYIKKYNIFSFDFNDLAINGDTKNLEHLSNLIIDSKLNINWSANIIPKKDLTLRLIKKLKKSGCSCLRIGIETGSKDILKSIKKYSTIDVGERILKDCTDSGIRTSINIIVGYPGEGEKEFQETLNYIKKNKKNISEIGNLSTCLVTPLSLIEKKPDLFNVTLPNKDHWKFWYDKSGNNYTTRKEKVIRLKKFAEDIKIPVINLNVDNEFRQDTIVLDKNMLKKETKKDILLVNVPPWGVDTPPLGISYLHTYLKNKGIKSKVFDMNIDLFNSCEDKDKKYWDLINFNWSDNYELISSLFKKKIDLYIKKIINEKTDLIGLSVNRSNLKLVSEISEKIKKKSKKKIIIGGYSTLLIQEIEKINLNSFDYLVIGEAEETLHELIKTLKKKGNPKKIKGIGFVVNKKIIKTKKRTPILLEKKFYPDYENLDLSKYRKKSISIILSRGCIGKCVFCDEHLLWETYRFRKADDIFEEINYFVKKGINTFSFEDLMINGNPLELKKFCELIIKNNITISWGGNALAIKTLDFNLLNLMKKAGCNFLLFGIETGSNRLLKSMNKYFLIEDAEKIFSYCKTLEIKTLINLIVGLPGETDEDFEKTLYFLKKNKKNIDLICNIFTAYIKPNSYFEKIPKKFGIKWEKLEHYYYWYDKTGNNHIIREERLKKLVEFCYNNNIEIVNINANIKNSFKYNDIKNDFNKFILNYKTENPNKSKKENMKNDILNPLFDILLVNPPPWGTDNPPIGLAYLSSYLENKGLNVEILDFNIDLFNEIDPSLRHLWHFENKNFWRDSLAYQILSEKIKKFIDEAVKKILESPAHIVGFSVVDPKERITIELIKRIKKSNPNKIVILGGPACSTEESRKIFVEEIPNLIDAYVVNEGESTLYEIIKAFKKKSSFNEIPGVITYKNGIWSGIEKRKKEEINDLIFPTYKGFDLNKYTTKSLTLVWSRGCIGNCAFCKIKGLWHGYQFREPEKIIEELEYHVKENNITKFTIADPTINGDIPKLEKVCDLIIKKDLKISWFGEGIPSNAMTLSLLKKMKEAGCYKIEYGVESGSNKILRSMRKPYTREIIEKTLKNTYLAGIPSFIFIIIGFPGETETDFKMTMDLIKKNRKFISVVKSVNMLHLIDDTDVFEKKERYGITILDPEFRHIHWVSDNGKNTYELRKNRTRRLINLLKQLNIPLLETNLNEGKETRLKSKKDLDENLKFDLFKKEISNIDGKLYHPNPEKIFIEQNSLNNNFLKKIISPLKLIDGVNLGIKKSEKKHYSFEVWAEKTEHITSSYGDKDNIANPCSHFSLKKTHWRDFAESTGITLKINKINLKLIKKYAVLKIKTYDNAYDSGEKAYPTQVFVGHNRNDWIKIGEFKINGKEKWIVFSFIIKKHLLKHKNLNIRLDDTKNYTNLKSGKKISWIKLYRD